MRNNDELSFAPLPGRIVPLVVYHPSSSKVQSFPALLHEERIDIKGKEARDCAWHNLSLLSVI